MKRRVLGITGGIASGKSTAVKILSDLGVPVISSDDLAHACIRKGTSAYRAIVKHFGPEILTKQKDIDRHALGRIVFADAKERKRLEGMVHPCVVKGLRRFINRHKGIIALDIPLLFEARLQSLVDQIVVIYCSRAEQIRRLMKRNKLSRAEALARLRAQMPIEKKRGRADILIYNRGTLKALRRHIETLLKD